MGLTEKELGYLAGFFDADGCVRIMEMREGHYYSLIEFTQNDLGQLEDIGKLLDKIRIPYGIHHREGTENYSESYELTIGGIKGELRFLRRIFPLLHKKKPEVEVAIKFLRSKVVNYHKPTNAFQREKQERYCKILKKLKK